VGTGILQVRNVSAVDDIEASVGKHNPLTFPSQLFANLYGGFEIHKF
jgi:hypothetical protein